MPFLGAALFARFTAMPFASTAAAAIFEKNEAKGTKAHVRHFHLKGVI